MKKFETPESNFTPVSNVYAAKSWNPGHGHDTTGTGNSNWGGSHNTNRPQKPHK